MALIQSGRMIYELQALPEETAREAFALAAAKLPFRTQFVRRTAM